MSASEPVIRLTHKSHPRSLEAHMSKKMHATPMLDQLESGPWPSFVTGLKRLAETKDMMVDLLGQLEHSYTTRMGYWKGGTASVIGYGGGVIPRFSEVGEQVPESAEFHTLRIMPAPGMHYDTATLRKFCDIWEKHGSGLIALHGQSGDVMLQGCTTTTSSPPSTSSTRWASTWAAPDPRCAPRCPASATRAASTPATTRAAPTARC
jgi:hypothetical protein